MTASDDQVTKKYQKVNDESAGYSEMFDTSPQLLLHETLTTDSKQRADYKAAERKRMYRERHREECKQRQQRYYEKHREELNKRKRDRRRQQNGSPPTPATPAERNRRYRERNKQIINERRRLQRNSQQVNVEYNMNKSNKEITEITVENTRTCDQGYCEEISAVSCQEEVDIKEQMTDVKLEPEVKLEVLDIPVQLTDTECPIFEPCSKQMLPRVDMFAIVQYFIQNGGLYEQLDFNKLKEDHEDLYADETIHHVQIHKNKASVTLQCSVAFNRTTSYMCLIKYNVHTKSIEYTSCECEEQACGHIIAFLMWIHRRSEERIDSKYL